MIGAKFDVIDGASNLRQFIVIEINECFPLLSRSISWGLDEYLTLIKVWQKRENAAETLSSWGLWS